MRKHGGAGRVGAAAAVAFVTLLSGLVLAPGASGVPGGPISGTPTVGETLTASPAHVYHWQRCNPAAGPCNTSGALWLLDQGWSDIPGAQGHNDRTYTLTEADLGTMVRVLGKDFHLAPFVSSPAVGPVSGAAPPVNTGLPSITGDAIVGSTLTVDDGSWQSAVDFETTRQWLRSNGSGGFDPIPGATGANYALEGETLTGDDGTWSGDPTTFARQWQRSDTSGGWDDIAGATGSTYELTVPDVNRRVRLWVVASNSGGDSDPAFSEPTDV